MIARFCLVTYYKILSYTEKHRETQRKKHREPQRKKHREPQRRFIPEFSVPVYLTVNTRRRLNPK